MQLIAFLHSVAENTAMSTSRSILAHARITKSVMSIVDSLTSQSSSVVIKNSNIRRDFSLSFLLKKKRKDLVHRWQRINEYNLTSYMRIAVIEPHEKLKNGLLLKILKSRLLRTTRGRNWTIIVEFFPQSLQFSVISADA